MNEQQIITIGIVSSIFALFMIIIYVLDGHSINGIKAKKQVQQNKLKNG